MSDIPTLTEVSPPEEPPRPRGRAALAWCVILLVVGAVVFWQRGRPARRPPAGGGGNPLERNITDMQARYLVGVSELVPQVGEQLGEQARMLGGKSVRQQLRAVVLAGELG